MHASELLAVTVSHFSQSHHEESLRGTVPEEASPSPPPPPPPPPGPVCPHCSAQTCWGNRGHTLVIRSVFTTGSQPALASTPSVYVWEAINQPWHPHLCVCGRLSTSLGIHTISLCVGGCQPALASTPSVCVGEVLNQPWHPHHLFVCGRLSTSLGIHTPTSFGIHTICLCVGGCQPALSSTPQPALSSTPQPVLASTPQPALASTPSLYVWEVVNQPCHPQRVSYVRSLPWLQIIPTQQDMYNNMLL